MPFDVRDFPGAPPEERAAGYRSRRLIAFWLFSVAGMIMVMIVLGGVTRLTGSGLSIMEWAPLSGILPPMNDADWQRLFQLYQQIPQYALVNEGFGLAGFKHIFWLEWIHRLWGRLIGLAFLGPLIWFWATGRMERRLRPRLFLLFVLGGLQGAVGWFMVASGFLPDATSVSPFRLVAHLGVALVLYVALLWTGLSVLHRAPRRVGSNPMLYRMSWICCGLVALTIVAGGFVAGTHAGFAYNTFPLMEGRLIPSAYDAMTPLWRNLTENIAAVQFDHRLLAILTALAAISINMMGFAASASPAVRIPLLAFGIAVLCQFGLGVATLLFVVPATLAALHQCVAVLTLTAAVALLHATRLPAIGLRQ